MKLHNIYEELLVEVRIQELTVDYFKKRIPFLRDTFHEVNYEKGVQIFLEQINHPDAKIINQDEVVNFKYFKTGINFEYRIGKVSGSDNVLHSFNLRPIVIAELDTKDKLLKTVHSVAMKSQLNALSVNESVELPKGAEIPDDKMDEIVNEMNKTFFQFEEFLSNFGVTLNI